MHAMQHTLQVSLQVGKVSTFCFMALFSCIVNVFVVMVGGTGPAHPLKPEFQH